MNIITRYWPKYPVVTTLTVLLILYLTLFPDPVPDNDLSTIEGMDKAVHAIMFGWFAFALSLDILRRHAAFAPMKSRTIWKVATTSIAFGGGVEILQNLMDLGRGGDLVDFASDVAGIIIGIFCAYRLTRKPSKTTSRKE